jgi:hypothetical protein
MQQESNGSGKPKNPEGYYKHKETGVIVKVELTPGVGTPMIDAYIQAGFVYNGTEDVAPKEELVVNAPVETDGKVVAKKK